MKNLEEFINDTIDSHNLVEHDDIRLSNKQLYLMINTLFTNFASALVGERGQKPEPKKKAIIICSDVETGDILKVKMVDKISRTESFDNSINFRFNTGQEKSKNTKTSFFKKNGDNWEEFNSEQAN